MKKRLVLTVPNRMGIIADLSFILGSAHINIEDINVITAGDMTVVDLQVSNEKKALELLKTNGYSPVKFEGLIIALPNVPGELAKVSKMLAENKIRIIRIDIIKQTKNKSILSIELDKKKKAEKILKEYLI